MEIWKDIIGYEGYYKISNLGNVKSLGNNKMRKEKILNPSIDGVGYFYVRLSKNGIVNNKKNHQLVAIAFLNHKPNGYKLVINHKDFNRLNNNINNLEIVTQRENTNLKHINSSSKYTGVSLRKDNNKWQSQIWINGKSKYLGTFKNEYDAHLAYEKELSNL